MYTYGKVWPDASILECLKLTRVGTDSVKLLRFIDIIDFRYINNNTKGYSEVVSGKDLNHAFHSQQKNWRWGISIPDLRNYPNILDNFVTKPHTKRFNVYKQSKPGLLSVFNVRKLLPKSNHGCRASVGEKSRCHNLCWWS